MLKLFAALTSSRLVDLFFSRDLLNGVKYGSILVQERARAAAMGYPDPTNPTFDATTESYHKTLMECLRRMKQYKDKGEDPKKIGIMVASHNEDTVRFAIEK